MNGFHDLIDEATYHADRTSLSVTGAKVILRSPALFRYQQDHPVHKDVFDIGSAAHALVLGVGAPIRRIEATDWRSKSAQEQKVEARAAGATPLLAKDHDAVIGMAERLRDHATAMRLLSEGRPEVSAYAIDEATGVMRRCRFDWLHPTVLVDYKSAASADPRDLAGRYGAVQKWGYSNQAAWYTDMARDLGHPASIFCLIVQEKTEPYQVTVAYVDDADLQDARQQNRQALERFRDCTESGLWPSYLPDNAAARLSLTDQTWEEEVIA